MNRLAIIDLGTNTFNLLIVERKNNAFNELYGERVGVGLGLGGINENRIAPDAFQRGMETLEAFQEKCREMQVERAEAFGTSAIRNAVNRQDFLETIQQKTGLDIHVISGEEEAAYIYKGVTAGLEVTEPFLIMDIGGGSTEFIYANTSQMLKAKSFEVGAARIFQQFAFSDPFSLADIAKIESYLEKHTAPFFDDIQVNLLVGASGSFETFYELIIDRRYPAHTYVRPNPGHFMYFVDRMIQSTKAERAVEDRIIPIRKKMGPIAAVKIRWIIRKLGIDKIMISPNSLKEGVLRDM